MTFAEDGLSVQYKLRKSYVFMPDMSTESEETIVTNVNPAFIGAVWSAGSEELVVQALGTSRDLIGGLRDIGRECLCAIG